MSWKSSLDFPGVHVVDEFDISQCPTGCVTKLMVNLIHDGLGRSLQLPIIVGRGKKPGKVLGLTAALHGNELNGISMIHRLFETLDFKSLRGTIVGVIVVNVPAFLNASRTFDDRTDMNHVMPGKEDGNVSEIYAHRFIERILPQFDYLIDLHTASFGNINSLYVRADMTDETTAMMAYLQRPQIILHNPPSDSTLRGVAMSRGVPAITVEIGDPQLFQARHIKASLSGVRRVMAKIGMSGRRPARSEVTPILCSKSQWLYATHGGILHVLTKPAQIVEEGEVVAQHHNIFGNITREYRAPHRGIVIGNSVNPVAPTGARILHLGTMIDAANSAYILPPEAETTQKPVTAPTLEKLVTLKTDVKE